MNSYFILDDDNVPANQSFDLCYCYTTCIGECDELAVRNLTEKQLNLLKLNRLYFHDCLIEEPGFDLNDFDQLMIDNIVLNSAYLMCPEDSIA